MQQFDNGAASELLCDLELAPANRRLANHWLSLWEGDHLPKRKALRPADIKELLPNIVMFDVVPDTSVVVRLAGTNIGTVLGSEITGKDWIDAAPPDYRSQRMRIFSDIAVGAFGRGLRAVEMISDRARLCEEILLPFGGEGGAGKLVLCHVDWDNGSEFAQIASRDQACGPALAFETILLPLRKAA